MTRGVGPSGWKILLRRQGGAESLVGFPKALMNLVVVIVVVVVVVGVVVGVGGGGGGPHLEGLEKRGL